MQRRLVGVIPIRQIRNQRIRAIGVIPAFYPMGSGSLIFFIMNQGEADRPDLIDDPVDRSGRSRTKRVRQDCQIPSVGLGLALSKFLQRGWRGEL